MTLVKRKENVFPSIWNDLFNDEFFKNTSMEKNQSTFPAVNIKESAHGFIIDLAVPGKKKEDFNIKLENNLLTISSENKIEHTEENKEENYTRREFRYSSFSRSFTLPETADVEKVKANYTDGVLSINISKKEEAKVNPSRLIEIG